MAGQIFDVARGNFELGDEAALLEQTRAQSGGYDPSISLRGANLTPTTQEQANAMSRAGMDQLDDGTFADPYLNIARNRDARYTMMKDRDREQREKMADSVLFKVGDTLADTGRMFLSPLFWLKGQDTTQFDPSERLKTGYTNQFHALEGLREANVLKFMQGRESRTLAANTLEINRRNSNQSGMSTEAKQLRSFAASSPERMQMLNDGTGASHDQLQKEFMLTQGNAVSLLDTTGGQYILANNQMTEVKDAGKNYLDNTKVHREGVNQVRTLLAALSADTPISDIAAIFSFIKSVDPGSTVRDSEVKLFADTLSLMKKFEQQLNKTQTGKILGVQQSKDLRSYAEVLGNIFANKIKDENALARGRMTSQGLDSRELQSQYMGSSAEFNTTFGAEAQAAPNGDISGNLSVEDLAAFGIVEET
jgi:hypothetical protein